MAYRDTVAAAANLLAYWPMDRGAASANNSNFVVNDTVSGRPLTCVEQNANNRSHPRVPLTHPGGGVEYGPQFWTRDTNGTDSASAPFNGIDGVNPFTFEMVARMVAPVSGAYGAHMRLEQGSGVIAVGTVADADGTAAERGCWSMARYNGSIYTTNGRGTTKVDNDGKWHHYAFTYDGSNSRLYVDGIVEKTVADTAASGMGTGAGTLYFAGKPANGNHVPSGSYGHPAVYGRARPTAEVLAHATEFLRGPSGQGWPR